MSGRDIPAVAVFGSSDPSEGEPEYELARSIGRKLAELGYAVVNGGYGGTMEASARGAREAGGEAIGVTCSFWRDRANPYIGRIVRTEDLWQRLAALLETSVDGCVALPGSTGTLLELAAAWEMMGKKMLPRRPLVCVGGFWRALAEMMTSARPGTEKLLSFVEGSEELERFFPPVQIR
jgi:uncharacterized protein (TIGR00725 family)